VIRELIYHFYQGPIGGVITAFTLINDNTKDEIDFEWVGSDRNFGTFESSPP
jgi:hypothetical protein